MYQRRTQGEPDPDSVFTQAYSLYQACRKSGTWAKLVMECGVDGEEVFSFSSKRISVPTYSTLTSRIPANPSSIFSKRKSPSKQKKDRVKWRAWLERKLEESKEPCREENSSQSGACEAPPPTSNSSYVPVNSVNVQCEDTAAARCTIHLQGDHGNISNPLPHPVHQTSRPAGGDEDMDQEISVDRDCTDPRGNGEEGGTIVPTPPTRILRSQSRSRSETPSRANTPPNPATPPTHRGRIPATPTPNTQKGVRFMAMPRSEFIALSKEKKKKPPPLSQEK